MYLTELLNGIACEIVGNSDPDITSLSCDTRTVKQGCLFFCISGTKYDGHEYFRKAIGDGASAIVTERKLDTKCLQIIVDDSRAVMSLCAKNFYGAECDKMKIISIVGTNGKTSTSYLLEAILSGAGLNTAVIGTNGIFFCGKKYSNSLTTPDPIDLHYFFHQMYLNGVEVVVMEVSAHAIALRKMYGITSTYTIFTNLSQDHLDYFKTMEEYSNTKKKYFSTKYTKNAIVNIDDELGKQIAGENKINIVTYSLNANADYCACNIGERDKLEFDVNNGNRCLKIKSSLHGNFNVYNILSAVATACEMGIENNTITQSIAGVNSIDGRNEVVLRNDGLRIVIDFAHTPDGIKNICEYLKNTTKGKLVVIFGCGGNRDKFKRPLMAEIVSKYCELAIITNDNPRYEDPLAIARDIESGMSAEYKIILNRKSAIEYAMKCADCNDTIAVLGKGAEKYQEIKGRKYPYSDIDTIYQILRQE